MNSNGITAKSFVAGLVLALCLGSSMVAQASSFRTADVSKSVQPVSTGRVVLAALVRLTPPKAPVFQVTMGLNNLQVVDFPSVTGCNHIAIGKSANMRFPLTDQVYLDLAVSGHRILEGGQDSLVTRTVTQTHVKVTWEVIPHLALFAGPQFGLVVSEVSSMDQLALFSGPTGPSNKGPVEAGSGFMVGIQVF